MRAAGRTADDAAQGPESVAHRGVQHVTQAGRGDGAVREPAQGKCSHYHAHFAIGPLISHPFIGKYALRHHHNAHLKVLFLALVA